MDIPWRYRVWTWLLSGFCLLPVTDAAQFSYENYLEDKLLPQESYVVDGDLMIGVILPVSIPEPGVACGSEVYLANLELMYALKFSVETINRRRDLLPGTRLGLYMVDDCRRYSVAIIRLLQMVSDPVRGPLPGAMALNLTYPLLALIGPVLEETTAIAGHVATAYNIPVIVPLGTDPRFENRENFPTVWSPVPGVNVMPTIFLKLLQHFRWTYFTLLYSDQDWGIYAYKIFQIEAQKLGMCVADSIMFYRGVSFEDAAKRVIDSGAEVLLIGTYPWDVVRLFQQFDLMGYDFSYHLMLTFQTELEFLHPWLHHIRGSLQYQMREPENPDLWTYLTNVWPGDELHNPWMQRYWRAHGWDATCDAQSTTPCYNVSHVVEAHRTYLLTRSVSAVYAVAQAIHEAVARKCEEAFGDIERIMACVTPSDVNDEMKDVTVETPTRTFFFNEKGDADIAFEIYQTQGEAHVAIGDFDMTTGALTMDDSVLDWGPYNWTYQEGTGYPYHRCSAPCPIGHFQIAGDVFCCWQCFPCREEEYLVDNRTSCERCPDKQWPYDEEQLECVEIPRTFLKWDNLYGAILTGLGGGGLLLTLLLSSITTTQRNLRAIKGSGVTMLHVILVGLYLAFASVFAHIAKPDDSLCFFGRTGFHLSFTLIFGPMLVKTNRVFQVFFAASKLSRKVFMGSELSQQIALATIISIQVGLTVLSVILWPAVAKDWMPVRTERYVELYCDVPQMSLIVGTSFNLLLIVACSILAFVARGLPDNFNESWYIFLCVVTTLFIWIAFFTTYFSAFYVVYKAALLAAALILNSLVVIMAFFGPKIYAVAFIADKDIKITNFEGSMSRGGQTETSVVSHGSTETNISNK